MSDLRTILVDGDEIEVSSDLTLLQACEAAGREIPRFCYHERLSVAGNCRMCLIEVKGAPKPVASCAQNVRDLRPGPEGEPPELITKSETVKKAREGVMEFLLINHPLDCPICDQGGECDLQDQSMAYGVGGSRYDENKRAVEEKYMGPLIKTVMTRCIQCTRCVRFVTEVGGVENLGMVNRGEDAEITTYLQEALDSELSGNIIDLCPVGALTSKPYAFAARPWELKKTETIDVMDAVGSNIRVDSRGRAVMRIQPRNNDDVNEEWLSDKGRFVWDGLRTQRLDKPYIKKDGRLVPASWSEALALVAEKLKGASKYELGAIAGDLACAESMKALKDLMTALGTPNMDCRQDGLKIGDGPRSSYLFNATIDGIEDADAVLLIGANPRIEAPVLNARIRKRYLQTGLPIASVGEEADLTYPATTLGASPSVLNEIASGSHAFAQVLKDAARPLIIVGMGALTRKDGAAIFDLALSIAKSSGALIQGEEESWNGFSVLHTAASRVAGLDLKFLPGKDGKSATEMLSAAQSGHMDVLYLLGADEFPSRNLADTFVIYQGSHGDVGAHLADVILPGAAYTEKNATWVNTEGRVQLGNMAIFPPGEAKEDWTIIRALSEVVGHTLPYNSLDELRDAMIEEADSFAGIDYAPGAEGAEDLANYSAGPSGELSDLPLASSISDFYLTNPIARASETMAECSAMFASGTKATGTEG